MLSLLAPSLSSSADVREPALLGAQPSAEMSLVLEAATTVLTGEGRPPVSLGAGGLDGDTFPAVVISHFPCVVGRHSGCDRRVPNPGASRRHCTFSLREGQVWVEDLGSLNGTWLNGERLTEARPVGDGDWLELAHLPFRVRLSGRLAGVAPLQPGALQQVGPG